jgi:adhesin/invasin
MRNGAVRALLVRVVAVVLPVLVLTTCTADSPLGVHRSVRALLDATALFQAGGIFPIAIDEVEVQVTEAGGGAQVLDTLISGADVQQSGGQISVALDVPLSQGTEDFDILVIARSGTVEYYRASTPVTVTAGSTVTTAPLTPTYTGPGASADGITFNVDTIIQSGDSALMVATATQGGSALSGVPVAFVSADSNDVRIRRSPGQALNQAWAVGVGTGPTTETITATLPNAAGTNAPGAIQLVERATRFGRVSGDLQTVPVGGSSLPIVVSVKTASQQPFVFGFPVTFSMTGPTGATLSSTTVLSDASGQASTTLIAGAATGSVTITATAAHSGAPLTGSPATFTATIGSATGPAANVTANSAVTQTATVSTLVAAPPSVKVTDANSNPVSGASVVFAITSGGGALTAPTTVATNALGIATSAGWTLGQTAGANTVTATVVGLPPVTFTGTGIAGAAASVTKVSGDAQTGAAASALPQPLVVLVKDAFGNLVSGATVNWATPNGGSLAPTSGPTNGSGNAQSTWTLGPSAPNQTATATVGALTPASFTATVGLPQIALGFGGIPGVGIGLTASVTVTLGLPAPVNGITVNLVSGNTSLFTVTPSVFIAQGQTTGAVTITGLAAGTANLTGSAAGYVDGVLPVTVQNRNISVPPTLNVPYGQTASLPIQLPAPAPAGGVSFTVVSSTPGNVTVASSPVTIPAGGQTANATLNGILPGPATITVSNPAYLDGITAAATTASLDITQTSVNPNASFGTPITVNFVSNGTAPPRRPASR